MSGIRITQGIKKIEVNDNGDYIVLRRDANFLNQIMSFISGMNVLQKHFNDNVQSIKEEERELKESANSINQDDEKEVEAYKKAVVDNADKLLTLTYDCYKQVHDAIDSMFGVDTCKKVFGNGETDVIPDSDMVLEFFSQLMPYITEMYKELAKNKAKQQAKPVIKPVGYMGSAPVEKSDEPIKFNAFKAMREQLENSDGDE